MRHDTPAPGTPGRPGPTAGTPGSPARPSLPATMRPNPAAIAEAGASVSITSLPPKPVARRGKVGAGTVVVAAVVALLVLLNSGELDPLLGAVFDRVGGEAQSQQQEPAEDDAQPVAAWYPHGSDDGRPIGGGNPGASNGAGAQAGDGAGTSRRSTGPSAIAPDRPSAPKAAVGALDPVGTPERSSRWRWPNLDAPKKVAPKLEPMPSCPQRAGASITVPVTAEPAGDGAVELTWYDLGDPDRRSYQIGAYLLSRPHPPAITWTKAAAPTQCGEISVIIRGLVRGGDYQFWLESVTQSPQDDNLPRNLMRGRSEIITIR